MRNLSPLVAPEIIIADTFNVVSDDPVSSMATIGFSIIEKSVHKDFAAVIFSEWNIMGLT